MLNLKLHDNRGETLVEVLASIVVAALSVTLLFSCVMTSSSVDNTTKGVDEEHYEALTGAESKESQFIIVDTGTVTIKNEAGEEATFAVDIYGGEGGVYSYKKR